MSEVKGIISEFYKGSLSSMLRKVYPDYDWMEWKFSRLPKRFLVKDPNVIERVLAYIEKERQISSPQDWYQVSGKALADLGVKHMFGQTGLYHALVKHRPDFPWQEDKFSGFRHFGERALGKCIERLWPTLEIIPKFDLSPSHKASYFIPSLKLAIIYQSVRSYGFLRKGTYSVSLREDRALLQEASSQSIRVLFVPFWWDRSLNSLRETVIEKFGDLKDTINEKETPQEPSPAIPKTLEVTLSGWN